MQDAAPFRLGDWLVEPELNQVSRDGEPQHLEAKSMDVLAYLARHADEVVSTDELLEAVWPDTVVEAAVVHRRINQIRHALGDDPKAPRYIQTILKRGYKVVARVESLSPMRWHSLPSGTAALGPVAANESVAIGEPVAPGEPVSAPEPAPSGGPALAAAVPGPLLVQSDGARVGRRRVLGAALLAVVIVALAALVVLQGRLGRSPPAQPGQVLSVPLALDGWIGWWTVNPGNPAPSIAMSAAGDKLVYVVRDADGFRRLAVRSLDGGDVRVLPGTEGAEKPFFSPDGRWVGYFDAQAMKRVATDGSAPSIITVRAHRSWGASWGEDDRIVYAETTAGLSSISVTGDDARSLTQLGPSQYSHRRPNHVAGHDLLLYTSVQDALDTHQVWALNTASGEQAYLFDGLAPVYVEPGYILYAEPESHFKGTLWAVRFDPASIQVVGRPQIVAGPVTGGRGTAFAAARAGPVVYLPWPGEPAGELAVMEPDGSSWVLDRGPRFRSPRLSSDGEHLVVARLREDDVPSLWIYDMDGRASRRFANPGAWPLWDPDGGGISYLDPGRGLAHRTLADESELIVSSSTFVGPHAWVDEDSALLYSRTDPGVAEVLHLWYPEGETVPLDYERPGPASVIAHGGQEWIAYCTWPSGIRVARFPNPTGFTVATESGCAPRWAPDGSRLYYQDGGALRAIEVSLATDVVLGDDREIADLGDPGGFFRYDLAADGGIVLARTAYDDAKPPVLLVNWQRLLD